MSSSEIAHELQKWNPDWFQKINRTTINEWIDQSGDHPQWNHSTLEKIQQGNNPGHHKGGHWGVLVRSVPRK
jgi:hypothetical protein